MHLRLATSMAVTALAVCPAASAAENRPDGKLRLVFNDR